MLKRSKIAFALGGGAARGFAHIGFLKVMEEYGIKPDIIVGTSMGAIVGALYSYYGGSVKKVETHFREFLSSDNFHPDDFERIKEMNTSSAGFLPMLKRFLAKGIVYGRTMTRPSIISQKEYMISAKELIPDSKMESLSIPFACVACDLVSGEEVIMNGGNLQRAVVASCAIPGIYEPLPEDNMLLIDGGWVDKTPAPAARFLGATNVIAVNVAQELEEFTQFDIAMEVILRSNSISTYRLNVLQVLSADVLIDIDLKNFDWLDFDKMESIVTKGYNFCQEKGLEIKKALKKSRWIPKVFRKDFTPLLVKPRIIKMSEGDT